MKVLLDENVDNRLLEVFPTVIFFPQRIRFREMKKRVKNLGEFSEKGAKIFP